MNIVPHFGHPKVYETFVWTHCFQILAKTMHWIRVHFTWLVLCEVGRTDPTESCWLPNISSFDILFVYIFIHLFLAAGAHLSVGKGYIVNGGSHTHCPMLKLLMCIWQNPFSHFFSFFELFVQPTTAQLQLVILLNGCIYIYIYIP